MRHLLPLTLAILLGPAGCLLETESLATTCLEQPTDACYRVCADNPAHPYCGALCSQYPDPRCSDVDGGIAMDAATDAGPCGGACADGTPMCDSETGTCVQCLIEDHCGDEASVCDLTDNTCVECTSDDDQACTGSTPHCDTSSRTCQTCLAHTDCTDAAAARCDTASSTHACVPCDDNDQCTGITDGERTLAVCNTGTCVECTTSDASACGGNPCTIDNACSAYGTDQDTCEPCDTDANCSGADHYCVPLTYTGTDAESYTPAPGYCLERSGGCSEPFTVVLAGLESLSGEAAAAYCGIDQTRATCEAVNALLNNVNCETTMTDDDCPSPAGICRVFDGLAGNRCTYPCASPTDCKAAGAGSTCDDNGTGGVDYCGG